jgi:hypothetical protein
MADELNMSDVELDRFFDQAGAFHKGERKEYPWPLNEPLYIDPEKSGPDEPDGENVHKLLTEAQKEYRQEIGEIFRTRWTLLFLMYDINPTATAGTSAWRELTGKLVLRHVPGLQETNIPPQMKAKGKRGAPRKHGPTFDADVVAAVEEARKPVAKGEKKLKISAAINKMDQEGSLKKYKMAASSFRARYHEAIKKWNAADVLPTGRG